MGYRLAGRQRDWRQTCLKNLTIVIPARNEFATLEYLLPEVKQRMPSAEIVVVNDGSTDDTVALCDSLQIKVISHPYPKGNGAAIKTGVRAASGDVLLFMDADGQHRPEDISRLLEKF